MIDTHVHFWDDASPIYSWINQQQREDLKRRFMLIDYLEVHADISAIVTVEASNEKHTLDEVVWIKQYIVDNPYQLPIKHIAFIDLFAAQDLFMEQLLLFTQYPFVCGFRIIIRERISFERMILLKKNLAQLKEKNYILNVQTSPDELLYMRDILMSSGVACIIDHAGCPDSDQDKKTWLDMLHAYANSHIYFKITKNDREMINELMYILSMKQLLIGSNYPVAKTDLTQFPDALINCSNQNARSLFKFGDE